MQKQINNSIVALEKIIGRFPVALLAGTVLELLAMLYTPPQWQPIFHGETFSKMSEAPWVLSSESWVQYRILSPILGYLIFLRGNNFVWFMLLIAVGFLSLIYLLARKKNLQPLEAIGISALMSFSTPLLFLLHFPGYTDLTTYIFILLLMMYHQKKTLCYLLFGVALFNHEIILFLVPWLVFLLNENKFAAKKYFLTLAVFILTALPYWLFRLYISSRVEIHYDLNFYF